VNNNYFRYSVSPNERFINIPVQITFDNLGREDGIKAFENDVLKDIINGIDDFETTRFANAPYSTNPSITEVNYQFYFFNYSNNISSATVSAWSDLYGNQTFTNSEVYYFANSFKNSFFKLDFYDTNTNENQRAYFSVIIPTQQGTTINASIGTGPQTVKIKRPYFILDYIGADKEGFFFYWLKNPSYLTNTTFYMSAKFFDGKFGVYVKMMKVPQIPPTIPSTFQFESKYFYYKVNIDYVNKTYEILDDLNVMVGTTSYIKWYEYINPL
jgi:hypothetical protein